jgi:mono/diheme cytochrome c family protein
MESTEGLRRCFEEQDTGTGPLRRHVRRQPAHRTLLKVASLVAVYLRLAGVAFGADSTVDARQVHKSALVRIVEGLRITPVEGDSWLRHLGSTFIASNMGRAGLLAAPPSNTLEQSPSPEGLNGDFILSGADLYRLSCQSCHKADGAGVGQEINSLLGPVQATSAVMIRMQMKQRGVELDAKAVARLVSQSTAALHARLQNGGEKMPSFRLLAPEEMGALLLYLDAVAGIPGAERRQIWLSEPAARVGELLVKGTCHICHEAIGPGLGIGVATPESIPSLASLPRDRSQSEVIRKVRQGLSKPTPMMTSSRGQMPIFTELTSAEVAAAYDYLVRYPPRR